MMHWPFPLLFELSFPLPCMKTSQEDRPRAKSLASYSGSSCRKPSSRRGRSARDLISALNLTPNLTSTIVALAP